MTKETNGKPLHTLCHFQCILYGANEENGHICPQTDIAYQLQTGLVPGAFKVYLCGLKLFLIVI